MVRVSRLIRNAGEAVSAILGRTEMEVVIRARTVEALRDAVTKINRSLRVGAITMGADVEV